MLVVLLNSPRELVERVDPLAPVAPNDETGASTSADDLAKSPKLYITDTQNGAVEFKINGQSHETFTAAQELEDDDSVHV